MMIKLPFIRHPLLLAALVGISLSATPAQAQDECLLNGNTTGGASAFGTGSLACGANASASTGSFQTVVGSEAVVSGNATTALGYGAFATDTGAIAIGGYDPGVDLQRTRADGADSVAIGHQTVASADGSVALGAGSIADQANTVSVGAVGNERRITNVASGTLSASSTDAINGGQLFVTNQNVTANTTAITALQTSDSVQNTAISSIQTVNATQATQITALQVADAGFDSRIGALEALSLSFDQDLDRIDDHASAGTAAAVALSGAMFLPGKTFNLTGNVGSYRGAHAAALQFGALVSDNVALNAGVAHGFNKGGKTALRAGFTVGW